MKYESNEINMISNELETVRIIRAHFEEELREHPETNTAWFLLRFYAARSGNMKETQKMVSKFFEWRRIKNMARIAGISSKVFSPLSSIHARGFYGIDKFGRPILIERLNQTDIAKFLSPEFDDIREDYMISLYEKLVFLVLPAASAHLGERVDSTIVIYDMKGVNFGKLFDSKFKAFSKLIVSIVQDYYPELLGKLVIVNAPFTFRVIWAFIKVFIDKKTTSKVEIYGGNAIDKLEKYVEVENLPYFLGGKCTVPITENPGPWKSDLHSSYSRKSFFLKDRSPEFEYYYTPEERDLVESKIQKDS